MIFSSRAIWAKVSGILKWIYFKIQIILEIKFSSYYLIFLFLVVKPQVKSTISNEEVYTNEFDQYANDISGLGF